MEIDLNNDTELDPDELAVAVPLLKEDKTGLGGVVEKFLKIAETTKPGFVKKDDWTRTVEKAGHDLPEFPDWLLQDFKGIVGDLDQTELKARKKIADELKEAAAQAAAAAAAANSSNGTEAVVAAANSSNLSGTTPPPEPIPAVDGVMYNLSWYNGTWWTEINGTWGSWTLDNKPWPPCTYSDLLPPANETDENWVAKPSPECSEALDHMGGPSSDTWEHTTTTEKPDLRTTTWLPAPYSDHDVVAEPPPVPRPADSDPPPPFPSTPMPPPATPKPFPKPNPPHQFPTEPPNPGFNKSFPKPKVWEPRDTTPAPGVYVPGPKAPTPDWHYTNPEAESDVHPPQANHPVPNYTNKMPNVTDGWSDSANSVDEGNNKDIIHHKHPMEGPGVGIPHQAQEHPHRHGEDVNPSEHSQEEALDLQRIFVSVYESGSTDRTKEFLSLLEAVLIFLGVPHHIERGNDQRGNRNRIEFLADIRNKAMRPLYDSATSYDQVLWLSDNYFCADGALQLLAHALPTSKGGLGADAMCGADYHRAPWCHFYDLWATTNIRGRRFRPIAPVAMAHEQEYQAGKPFQVFSCWSGFVVFAADLFQKERLLFRRNVPPWQNECAEPETELIFHDMWRLGRGRIAMSPQVKVAYTWPNFRQCALQQQPQEFDQAAPLEFQTTPPEVVSCCPLGENASFVNWDDCMDRPWDQHRRRVVPRMPRS